MAEETPLAKATGTTAAFRETLRVGTVNALSYLPLPVLYLISDLVYLWLYHVLRYQRRRVDTNLARAFPDASTSERARIARRSYRNTITALFETIKVLRISRAEILRRVQVRNQSLIEDYLNKGQMVIAATAHQCNWEWLLPVVSATLSYPVDGVYKPLRSPALTDLLIRVRSRFGSHPIPTTNVTRELLKRRHIPRLLGLVADLCPEKDEEKHWTRFLNQDTAFYTGPGKLARVANAPLVFIAMSRIRRGYYEISFEPLAEPPYCETPGAILERYVRRLEAQILSQPEDWLWIYHRWRYPTPQSSDSL